MTDQEIEKLREKLGSEYSVKRQNGAITVELVNIWKGVEFAECVQHYKSSRTVAELFEGQIYRITDWFKRELVYFEGFEYGFAVGLFKPSTESAYVEQLKSKAKDLYGEIKDGDSFVLTWIGNEDEISIRLEGKYDFYYYKKSDTLELHGFPLYNQGEWAKKVEMVNVEGEWNECSNDHLTVRFKFEYKGSHHNPVELSDHLAKCLEQYLNK